MSLNSIHKEIQKKELDELRKKFNNTEDVTIKISTAHLDFIRESLLKPFEMAAEAEKDKEEKPATKIYEEITSYPEDKLRQWLISTVVGGYVNEYVRNSLEALNSEIENK